MGSTFIFSPEPQFSPRVGKAEPYGHVPMHPSLGRNGVSTLLWESRAALVRSDFPPYDRVL